MKARPTLAILLALGLLLITAIVVACGDDDKELTLGEYFQQVDKIQNDFDASIEDLNTRIGDASNDPDAARSALASASQIAKDSMTDLKAIEAPSEAASAHGNLVTAGEAVIDAIDDLVVLLQNVEAGPQYETLVADIQAPDSNLNQLDNAFDTACAALQTIADSNAIDVDLGCEPT